MCEIGNKYGMITIIGYCGTNKYNKKLVNTLCDCGKYKIQILSAIKNGVTKTCGCSRNKTKPITQLNYGRLTIIDDLNIINGIRFVKCKCSCGNNTVVRLNDLKNGMTKSCGCLFIEMLKNNSGNKHYNWKGGITPISLKIRNSIEYSNWRTACFERDNYTCQVTGEKSIGNIEVHHLYPLNKIIKDIKNGINNDLIFDINNGITITKDVHKKFHKIYGKLNFNKEDFISFSTGV